MPRPASLSLIAALTLVSVAASAQRGPAPLPRSNEGPYGALAYRFIGPPGNRVSAVTGIAGDPYTYYLGAASGGIWKTTDGGVHWTPLFDDQPVSSIGAIAVAPSNTNVVWAGTGESMIRSHISMGWGMFRSTDAGKSWQRAGLEATGRIARISVDPRNADVAVVAALGHAYAPQQDRGIFRTTDGGRSWKRVLFVNDSSGGVDVVRDPNDPDHLYAATWQIEIHTWGRTSGGAGSGIWQSRDGGATWTRLAGHGLPERPFGKVGLGVTAANSNRVYALIETGKGIPWNGAPTDTGVLWRSDDAGAHWKLVNSNANLTSRPAYYTRMAVEPDSADQVYFLSIGFSGTRDGGLTMSPRSTAQSPGFDNHDMWIDPQNGRRMIVANDEGVSISVTRGETWQRTRLPIAQMYHVTTDNRVPYTVCGNMQDGPSTCGPSNSKISGTSVTGNADIPRGMWYSVGGGESGWATPDPVDPNIVWTTASGRGSAGGIVVRYDVRVQQGRDVEVWPVSTAGHAARDVTYRFVWDFPIAISPHDHTRIYVGSQFVHRTINGGQSWELISPDLTLNDKSKQQHSGGLTGDNIGVEYGDVIYSIAESPAMAGVIWAGTNDGLVQLTRDGGTHWENVTKHIPGMPAWGTVSNIEPSRFHAGTAYITVNAHQEGNVDPFVYKTADFGATWTPIVNGLPKSPVGYARCVREDPRREGLLYLGTENAIYVSFDDGARWEPMQLNLPHAPVSWLTVQDNFHDLVIATYGRGFYVLDDITPLQQLTPAIRASAAHLFTPRPAYRFVGGDYSVREAADDPSGGHNPPAGALVNYWIGAGAAGGGVSLTILDSAGKAIRSLSGPSVAGLNRVAWDLRYDPLTPVLGTTAAQRGGGAPPVGAEEGNPVGGPPQGGRGRGRAAPVMILAPPGRYSVRLRAGGSEFVQSFSVLRDPSTTALASELRAQARMLEDIARDVAASNALTAGIEGVRTQLAARSSKLDASAAEVRTSIDAVEKKFAFIADSLVQQNPGAFYEWPQKLTAKFSYLASEVQTSDHQPTTQAREADTFLKAQLKLVKSEYSDLLAKDLAELNDLLKKRGLAPVLTVQP